MRCYPLNLIHLRGCRWVSTGQLQHCRCCRTAPYSWITCRNNGLGPRSTVMNTHPRLPCGTRLIAVAEHHLNFSAPAPCTDYHLLCPGRTFPVLACITAVSWTLLVDLIVAITCRPRYLIMLRFPITPYRPLTLLPGCQLPLPMPSWFQDALRLIAGYALANIQRILLLAPTVHGCSIPPDEHTRFLLLYLFPALPFLIHRGSLFTPLPERTFTLVTAFCPRDTGYPFHLPLTFRRWF